jgi:putative transcriptional regulator
MAGSEGSSKVVVPVEALRENSGRIDRDRIRNTTEADIEGQKAEDNHPGPEHRGPVRVVIGGPNVSELRAKFGISQEEFAHRFGISLRTLQQWEQKRRAPDGPAKLLLRIIEQQPEAVEHVVRGRGKRA